MERLSGSTLVGGAVDTWIRDEHQAEAVMVCSTTRWPMMAVGSSTAFPTQFQGGPTTLLAIPAILDHQLCAGVDDNNGGRRVEIGVPRPAPTVVTITPDQRDQQLSGTGDGFSWAGPERNPAASVTNPADAAVAVAPIATAP